MLKTSVLTLIAISSLGLGRTASFRSAPRDIEVHPMFFVTPASMTPGSQAQVTLYVDTAGSSSTVVNLSSSDTTQLTVPSTVTVPAGETSVPFNVTATSTASTSATITGTANSASKTSSSISF